MSKHIQLSISDPCHENWDNMTPVEKGRFCGSCQKQVVDFTNMSDREVAQFFKKPSTGSVCGRFMQDQLDRSIEIPKKRIPWVKYFFQITIPAFLVSLKASAQKEQLLMGKVAPVCTQQVMGNSIVMPVKMPVKDSTTISGKVFNENGEPVSFAAIRVKETLYGVAANEDGTFSMSVKAKGNEIIIIASAVGFESKEINFKPGGFQNIILELNPNSMMGEVVVVSNQHWTTGLLRTVSIITYSYPISDIKSLISDTVKFYPNPLRSGSIINLEVLRWGQGKSVIEFYNMAGQKVYFTEVNMNGKSWKASLPLPALVPGVYIAKVYLDDKKKSYSTKIIVQ